MAKIDTNIAPYYNDFDENKNFHQILFNPGMPVQARELTQIQSIIQNQVSRFGNHVFQQGSIVIPGNSFSDLKTPYIKIQPMFGIVAINAADFENKVIIGANTGIRAVVKKALPATQTDPITFYLAYLTGGATSTFNASEELYLEVDPTKRVYAAAASHIGYGSMAFVNAGIYFVNGHFVRVDSQSIVISKYSSTPSCHVLLQIKEEIITSSQDDTLLDPAQGSYNFAAPGADRLKISLVLTSLAVDAAITDDYVEIMRFRAGVLEEHSKYPKYSELEKSMARRTYDESGDYLVNGYAAKIVDHLKTPYNNGLYENGDRDKFVLQVSAGKAYIQGFETESISQTDLVLDKARTPDHVKNKSVSSQATYGQFLYVTGLKTLPNFRQYEQVSLYNDNDPLNGSATLLGTLRVIGIDYYLGDPNVDGAIYKLYFNSLSIGANDIHNIGGIRFGVAGSMSVLTKFVVQDATKDFTVAEIVSNAGATRVATVQYYSRANGELYVYKHDHTKAIPISGDIITGSSVAAPVATVRSLETSVFVGAAPLFQIPADSIKAVKNISNNYDISYSSWKTITINTNGAGSGSFTITDGTFKTPEAGLTVAVGPSGIVALSTISLSSPTTINITGGPLSSTVVILTQVLKSSVQARTKTLNTLTLTGVTPAATISLGKADIYKLVSVFAGTEEITDRCVLNNGQTDYYYGLGSVAITGTLPGTNLDITFEYFTHTGTGDYFSIDSYATLGVDYIAKVPTYRSPSTAKFYDLSDYLDFRPRVGDDGTFTAGTAALNDAVVVDSVTTTSVQYFVPRIDVIYLTQTNDVSIHLGIPSDKPIKPSIPGNSMELYTMLVPAYTNSINDIIVKRAKNKRYTMSEINKIEDRIANIEYFSTLNATENSLLAYEIVDSATGLNRFKNGYLVDNFENPFTVCDFYNRYNMATFSKKYLSANKESHDNNMVLESSSTDYSVTNTQITLPYVETPLISQKTSTRVTSVNPFTVFSWEGTMTIVPPSDSWAETEDLPAIFNTRDEVVHVSREERYELPPAPSEPAPVSPPVISGPDIPTPVQPSPPVDPLVRITAWGRDIGITGAGADTIVGFSVPQSAVDQIWSVPAGTFLDPIINPTAWAQAIEQTNQLAAIGGITTAGAETAAAIIDRWTQ